MLITYRDTLEPTTHVAPGDEAEIFADKKIVWVIVMRVDENGSIRVRAGDENIDFRKDFQTKQDFFDAIGDV